MISDPATPRVVLDPELGYRHLDPMPSDPAIEKFYESQYRDLLNAGGRAPELTRLVDGGPDADLEREWLTATLYADIVIALDGAPTTGRPRRSLDIGCGTGDVVRAVAAAGWDAVGIEPAEDFAEVGRAAGLRIETTTAGSYLERWRASGDAPFDGITFLNVLEHVPDPRGMVIDAGSALAPGGRLVVRVPNDFNPLQEVAIKHLGGPPWWISVPDHVNYFDHASIASLVEGTGLEVVDRLTDFPMELFLLMGDDYRADRAVGRASHHKRVRMEMALDPDLRRAMGRSWVALGLGRNAFVVARKPE